MKADGITVLFVVSAFGKKVSGSEEGGRNRYSKIAKKIRRTAVRITRPFLRRRKEYSVNIRPIRMLQIEFVILYEGLIAQMLNFKNKDCILF